MSPRCPYCGASVLTRRHPACASCRKPLPESMVMTADELADVEAAEHERERQAEERQRRREEALRAARDYSGG